jgi:Putative transmembrane protein (PGPGW)
MRKKLQRFGIDFAGYALILLGIATGWLPGPGGIPLILAGLGLLSIHNHWAKKIIDFLKEHGSQTLHYIFPNNRWAQAAHDILVLILLSFAVYVFVNYSGPVALGLSIGLTALAVVDFLYNRDRLRRIKRH